MGFKGTLYSLDLFTNSIFIAKIVGHNYEVYFRKDSAKIINDRGEEMFLAEQKGDLFFIQDYENANFAKTVSERHLSERAEILEPQSHQLIQFLQKNTRYSNETHRT